MPVSTTRIAYKDTIDVITDFKNFINNTFSGVSGSPITDPLSDAGITRGSGTGLAVFEDDTKIANFPKITFEITGMPRERIAGGKNAYRERVRHEFLIIYTCGKGHTWTYGGTAYKGKQQCIKYLRYLADKIKTYSGSFDVNEIVLGSISPPRENPNTHDYTAMLPIKADSFGIIGS